MSLSRGCIVVEREQGKWYCVVATDEYDYEFERGHLVYGPRSTADSVYDEMRKHECNPGGHSEVSHDKLTPRLIELVDTGIKPYEPPSRYRWI